VDSDTLVYGNFKKVYTDLGNTPNLITLLSRQFLALKDKSVYVQSGKQQCSDPAFYIKLARKRRI
jgi:hypothetical protein